MANRLISTNLHEVALDRLPPTRREGATRILFITNAVLGWRTYGSMIERFTAGRDDIDAVHVRLHSRLPVRILSARLPGAGNLLQPHLRRVLAWRWVMRRWLDGPLPLSRFDLVHVAPHLHALAASEVKARSGVRLSVSIDSVMVETKAQRNALAPAQAAVEYAPLLGVERRVFDAADLVCPMSRWASDSLQREYELRADQILICPPVIDQVPASNADLDRPAATERTRIVFVGNDWERKGGPRLLRWHQERWVDKAELHVFSQARRPPGLRGVVWHGRVSHDELLQRWLPAMDVFVLPTRSDMSPWATVEAASVGLPIVSSAIGGLPEVVIDGKTGYLLTIDDEAGYVRAVERLIDDPELRRRMGRAAREHAESNLNAATVMGRFLDRLVDVAG